ncbi:MAG: B12-binding domain-containing radical SAM protein [Nitrospirae bacterium]|nr:MAG: B12-binding domain-containing radical SAM protein [Nitrospirota bacterium]
MLLINPASEKFGGFLSRYVPIGIPVAVGSLAGYLRQHGIKVNILDEEVTDVTPDSLAKALEGLDKPYVIGFSCLTAHVARAYEMSKMVKRLYPDSIVITGGLHASALPEESLEHDTIDIVVRGEGEQALLHLYQAIRGGKPWHDIGGLSYRQNGAIKHNPEAPLIPDLDSLPMFPYDMFTHPRYEMGFITSSRGCPYKCTYCSQRMLTGTSYRYKSAKRIVEELQVLIEDYGQKQILFYDDNFSFMQRRVIEVCDRIVERGLHRKCSFSIQTRADNIPDPIIPHMRKANFVHVGFGMETGSERLAKIIVKGETVADHIDAVKRCQKAGFETSLFMIFGLPTEVAQEREDTYKLVQSLNVQMSKYNNLIPYPGTPLYTDLKDSPRVKKLPGWANFNSTLSATRSIFDKIPLPYVPETMGEFELKRDIIRYNFRTYLKLKPILAILTRQKGVGWVSLPERWYFKPVELYHVTRVALNVATNLLIAYLPRWMTQPLMHALNPALKERMPVPMEKEYVTSGWGLPPEHTKMSVINAQKPSTQAHPESTPALISPVRRKEPIGV